MAEPKLKFCTVRGAITTSADLLPPDSEDFDEYHLECRFADGQKLAAVTVNGAFPELADRIAAFLNFSATDNLIQFGPDAKQITVNPALPTRSYYTKELLKEEYSKGSVKFAAQVGLLNVPELPFPVEARKQELLGIAEAFAALCNQMGFKMQVAFEPIEGLTERD
ncbi:MAG: hypothetical protein P4L77_10575 [Sulfuriferula sp.]|nr:hypothetical protein [Sulfuriferula sp.]